MPLLCFGRGGRLGSIVTELDSRVKGDRNVYRGVRTHWATSQAGLDISANWSGRQSNPPGREYRAGRLHWSSKWAKTSL